jgi:hypothetical protein
MKRLGLGLVLVLVCFAPRAARAQTGDCEGGCALFLAASVGAFVVAAVPGLVGGVANTTYVARGQRPPLRWLITGYVSAGLNLGVTAFMTVLLRGGGPPAELGLLIGSATIGAFDLVMTIWGHSTATGNVARFLPAPSLVREQSGAVVLGLSSPVFRF